MMTQTPTKCPPTQTLHDYALGRLPDEASDELFEHVGNCELCSTEIETIDDGEDSLIGSLRSPDPLADFANEPACDLAVAKVLGSLANDPVTDSMPPGLPRQIGEYEIVRPLGRGGMGRVYLARHTKLGREVALKVLANHRLADPRMRQRFEAEMRAVGRLSHPNIVTAHDAREVEGTAVLVTEFIDGLDLGKLVNTIGPLSIADACQIVRRVAVALAYCDEQGFVHRDVKPSNIMLSRSGEVKLLDLGLARLQDGDPDQVEITGTGQTMGTADYIAPEQVTDSRNVDIRVDIYSLGCTLMKLLTGEAPFAKEAYPTPFAKMTAHVSAPPPRLNESIPDAPKTLVKLLGSMLEKDPNKRPQSPIQVAERLLPFTEGSDLQRLGQTESTGSIEAKPQRSATVRSQAERRRHVPLWVAIAAAVVGLVLGVSMGILITIEYPDGTTAQIVVPSGSTVTMAETNIDDSSDSDSSDRGPTAPLQELAPMQEIGDGTISSDDPLAFVIFQIQENVTDAELEQATSSLEMFVRSDPTNDRVVTTDAGIWVRLAEDVAAPIVHSYNGNRYGLALGSSSSRIGWDQLFGHIVEANQTTDNNGSPAIDLKFDAALGNQFSELTGNHVKRQLAIVVDGTVRLAPNIQQRIGGSVHLTGRFSKEETQEIVENLKPALVQGIPILESFDAETVAADLQGIWSTNLANNSNRDPGSLVIFDQQSFYYYSDPKTLKHVGTFTIDFNWSQPEMVLQQLHPERLTLRVPFEIYVRDRLLLNRHGLQRKIPNEAEPIALAQSLTEPRSIIFDRVGGVPQSPAEFRNVADRIARRWQPLISLLEGTPGSSAEQTSASLASTNDSVQTLNSMMSIGLAFHNFHAGYRKFPGSQNVLEGRRGVNEGVQHPFSWRVALLPFLEQNDLFEQYRFDQPWDSEHNLTLIEKMPDVYRCQAAPADQAVGETNYLGFATEDGGLGITGHPMADFTDGISLTALVIASKKSVPWTQPADLTERVDSAVSDVEPLEDESIFILRADGWVERMSPIDRTKLQKMSTRNGGEPLE